MAVGAAMTDAAPPAIPPPVAASPEEFPAAPRPGTPSALTAARPVGVSLDGTGVCLLDDCLLG